MNIYRNVFIWLVTLGSFLLLELLFGIISFDGIEYYSIAIIIIPVIGILINPKLSLAVLIGALIGLFIKTDVWTEFISYVPFIQVGITTILALIVVLNTNILTKNYGVKLFVSSLITLSTWLILSTIIVATYTELIADRFIMVFSNLLFLSVTLVIFDIIIYSIERIYASYNKQELFDNIDSTSFYKLSKAKEELNKIIKDNRYQFGLFLTFAFDNFTKKDLINKLSWLKKQIEKNYSDAVFFKSSGNHHSLFVPMTFGDVDLTKFKKANSRKQKSLGYLTELQNIIETASTSSQTVKGYATIYGVDSTNINELMFKSHELQHNVVGIKNTSPIFFFDYAKKRRTSYERSQAFYLPEKIIDSKIDFIRSPYVSDVYYYLAPEGENDDIAKRFIALKAIKTFDHFKDAKLVFEYPVQHISQLNFNRERFIKKIKRITDPSSLILGIKTGKASKLLESRIKWFRTQGFGIALLDAEKTTKSFVAFINPEYYLFKRKEFSVETLLNPASKPETKIIIKAMRL